MITVTGFPSLPDIICPSDNESASATDLLELLVQPLANRDAYRSMQCNGLSQQTALLREHMDSIIGGARTLDVDLETGKCSQSNWNSEISGAGVFYQTHANVSTGAPVHFKISKLIPQGHLITGFGFSARIAGGHSALPELLPRMMAYCYDKNGTDLLSTFSTPVSTIPTPVSVAAYNGSFQVFNVILEDSFVYQSTTELCLAVWSEDGANAIPGLQLRSVRVATQPVEPII